MGTNPFVPRMKSPKDSAYPFTHKSVGYLTASANIVTNAQSAPNAQRPQPKQKKSPIIDNGNKQKNLCDLNIVKTS